MLSSVPQSNNAIHLIRTSFQIVWHKLGGTKFMSSSDRTQHTSSINKTYTIYTIFNRSFKQNERYNFNLVTLGRRQDENRSTILSVVTTSKNMQNATQC